MIKFNKALKDIKIYEAGKPIELLVREFGIAAEDVVKLASNENPIGTNPAISKVIRSNADIAHLYPDDSMFELKAALSAKFDVQDENIIIIIKSTPQPSSSSTVYVIIKIIIVIIVIAILLFILHPHH